MDLTQKRSCDRVAKGDSHLNVLDNSSASSDFVAGNLLRQALPTTFVFNGVAETTSTLL